MKHLAFASFLLAALCGCDVNVPGGDNVHERLTRSMPAAGVTTLDVRNVSGSITIVRAKNGTISIDARKRGANLESLRRTAVDNTRTGGTVTVKTTYDKTGGGWFWPHHNGASVDYRISVPAAPSLRVENVSGAVSIAGAQADVHVTDVSGTIDATLGRLSGKRDVSLQAVSGAVHATIARHSDVRIKASTVSGGISQFAAGDVHDARLGSGTASLNLSTISGAITVSPQ